MIAASPLQFLRALLVGWIKKILPPQFIQIGRVVCRSASIKSVQYGNITFLCPNTVMEQIARDISLGLELSKVSVKSRPILVFLGIHCFFGRHWLRRGFKVGIQTEQLRDENFKPLWGEEWPDLKVNVGQALMFSHSILDLGVKNQHFYEKEKMPTRRSTRFLFGPYIFPSRRVPFRPKVGGVDFSLLFFGSLVAGSRRQLIIEDLANANRGAYKVTAFKDPLFGDELKKEMQKHDAILNIHFAEGLYMEAPRLLSAYVNGKPVVSEPLGAKFDSKNCYMPIDDIAPSKLNEVHEIFSDVFVPDYSFLSALRRLGAV